MCTNEICKCIRIYHSCIKGMTPLKGNLVKTEVVKSEMHGGLEITVMVGFVLKCHFSFIRIQHQIQQPSIKEGFGTLNWHALPLKRAVCLSTVMLLGIYIAYCQN